MIDLDHQVWLELVWRLSWNSEEYHTYAREQIGENSVERIFLSDRHPSCHCLSSKTDNYFWNENAATSCEFMALDSRRCIELVFTWIHTCKIIQSLFTFLFFRAGCHCRPSWLRWTARLSGYWSSEMSRYVQFSSPQENLRAVWYSRNNLDSKSPKTSKENNTTKTSHCTIKV